MPEPTCNHTQQIRDTTTGEIVGLIVNGREYTRSDLVSPPLRWTHEPPKEAGLYLSRYLVCGTADTYTVPHGVVVGAASGYPPNPRRQWCGPIRVEEGECK